jgi:hypothetical protein
MATQVSIPTVRPNMIDSTSPKMTRRDALARLLAIPVFAASAHTDRPPITVYKSATCGCCTKWVDYVRKAGFAVTTRDTEDMDRIKRDLGVPSNLASCHTAVVGRYVIEGHVPADLIDKLLAEKPTARGLTIPGMPASAPGMDIPGEPYQVLLFTSAGKTTVYARR